MMGSAWSSWPIIEDDIRRGRNPDPRHIAEAFRRGEAVTLSRDLQRHLADLIAKAGAPPGRRGPKEKSVGAKHAAAVELINKVAELRAAEIERSGRRGSLKKALEQAGAGDVERKYRAALRLRGVRKSAKT